MLRLLIHFHENIFNLTCVAQTAPRTRPRNLFEGVPEKVALYPSKTFRSRRTIVSLAQLPYAVLMVSAHRNALVGPSEKQYEPNDHPRAHIEDWRPISTFGYVLVPPMF